MAGVCSPGKQAGGVDAPGELEDGVHGMEELEDGVHGMEELEDGVFWGRCHPPGCLRLTDSAHVGSPRL